ncbi:MAG: hypothetical protein ACRDRH_17090 [Pseudonocardia sp.]
MIVWLNGPFGVGKSSAAAVIRTALPESTRFDPELVGVMLREIVPALTGDFQDLPLWRRLVVEVSAALHDESPLLITPMTLVREDYAREIWGGLALRGVDVQIVLLHADGEILTQRIRGDHLNERAQSWRLDHLDAYKLAMPWLTATADYVVDTTQLSSAEVGSAVLDHIRRGARPSR